MWKFLTRAILDKYEQIPWTKSNSVRTAMWKQLKRTDDFRYKHRGSPEFDKMKEAERNNIPLKEYKQKLTLVLYSKK